MLLTFTGQLHDEDGALLAVGAEKTLLLTFSIYEIQ